MQAVHAAAPSRAIQIKPVSPGKQVPPDPSKASCSSCHLRALCLPCGLEPGDMARLDALMLARRKVGMGETLYDAGERFHFIHAVRRGTFKSSLVLADGREQISGFHMAGELMGLDGLAHGAHASSTVALEDAEICAIPYAQLRDLACGSAALQQVVHQLMSREIVREHGLMMLLGSMSAEERLAAFLLNMSQRLKSRGYSALEFHLRMSRAEIGSYLGMKLETVSRAFSAFQSQGLLDVDKRHIRINNLTGLAQALESSIH